MPRRCYIASKKNGVSYSLELIYKNWRKFKTARFLWHSVAVSGPEFWVLLSPAKKWSRSLPCLKVQIHKDRWPLWCWWRYWCIKIQCTMTNPYEAKHYRKYHWSLVNTRRTTLFCGISKILVKRPVEIKGHQLNEKQNVKEPDESEKSMLKVCCLKSESPRNIESPRDIESLPDIRDICSFLSLTSL